MVRLNRPSAVIYAVIIAVNLFAASANVYAGKLYIKPDLERKRATRLLSEADHDFQNAKIHITLSPEISLQEFKRAKEKFEQVATIVDKYGAGYYSPGDLADFESRIDECTDWIEQTIKRIAKETR